MAGYFRGRVTGDEGMGKAREHSLRVVGYFIFYIRDGGKFNGNIFWVAQGPERGNGGFYRRDGDKRNRGTGLPGDAFDIYEDKKGEGSVLRHRRVILLSIFDCGLSILRRKTEDGRQKAEVRRQKTEFRILLQSRNGKNRNFKNDVISALSMGYKPKFIRKMSGFYGEF
jgi:hypothetical protein